MTALSPASRNGRLALVLAWSLVGLATVAPSAQAGKQVDHWIGAPDLSSGTLGGEFHLPKGVAVHEATGQVYVGEAPSSDDEPPQRIQRFGIDGDFELAFGKNVVQPGAAADQGEAFEICVVAGDCRSGEPGGGGGELNGARGIAVDQTTGDLFVMDAANARVQQFRFDDGGATPGDPSDDLPVFERAWGWDVVSEGTPDDTATDEFEVCTVATNCKSGTEGDGKGQFAGRAVLAPRLAIHPTSGDVFVADRKNGRIQHFDPDAAPPAGVLVGEFGVSGDGGVGEFHSTQPQHVAVDSKGIVYASDGFEGDRIQRYDSEAAVLGTPGFLTPIEVAPSGPLLAGSTRALEMDRATDHLLVLRRQEQLSDPTVVQELDTTNPGGTPSSVDNTHFAEAGIIQASQGLGADAERGEFYISMTGNGGCSCVFVLDDDGASAPEASLTEVTDVTGTSAVAHGTVNPVGGVATFRFELSKDGAEWAPASTEDTVNGPGPNPVSTSLTGVEANTDYHVRIVALKPFGGPTAISNELTFTTDRIPPEVITGDPANRTDTTARVVGMVNPNNLATTYRIEYGETDAYGQTAPIAGGDAGSGAKAKTLVETLSGLEPATTYHYRFVASNGEEELPPDSPGDTDVEGEDKTFTTRPSIPAEPDRAYEMVTPPFKVTRAIGRNHAAPGENPNPGVAAIDGERIVWSLGYLPLLDETAAALHGDRLISRRTPAGWATSTLQNIPALAKADYTNNNLTTRMEGASGDLETQAWSLGRPRAALLPNEGNEPLKLYTRRDGFGNLGWTGWLSNVDATSTGYGLQVPDGEMDNALFNDDGTWMVRWGDYRGLISPIPSSDPSVTQLHGPPGGSAVYRQGDPPNGELDLVNECTGVAGGSSEPSRTPTQVPERTAVGMIGVFDCVRGDVTSKRGAAVGFPSGGLTETAMSQNGGRIFFTSPDPTASTTPSSCSGATGPNTDCTPQLFVRQYDSSGDPIVRWISQSEVPGQEIGLFGSFAAFEGASKDGRFVYFRTDAPLTVDDPNGSGGPGPATTGTASGASWDLYRYELPQNLDEDPDDGSLVRVSGGPNPGETGADPSTNRPDGAGGAARYVSDDGKRAYFVTTSPLGGADHTLPAGGVTSPGGTVGNETSRNLYLFDDNGGQPAWKFIARLPFADGNQVSLDACATFFPSSGMTTSVGVGVRGASASCMRGNADGRVLAFITGARLTGDDVDEAADIYLYDAGSHELTRVTATSPQASPKRCLINRGSDSSAFADYDCNGSWGFSESLTNSPERLYGWGGLRRSNIGEDQHGVISLYFESRQSLVPGDTNGDRYDVYQWREGELSLISPGNSDDYSWYAGNSHDGEDVFIFTSQRIDPRELDDADYDIYDARLGGGFPYTPPPTLCDVLAFECEKDAERAPAVSPVATSNLAGEGNVTPKQVRHRCPRRKLRRGKRCLSKSQIARRACRKAKGRQAKRRCIRKQIRRLNVQAKARRACRGRRGASARRRCVRNRVRRITRGQKRRIGHDSASRRRNSR